MVYVVNRPPVSTVPPDPEQAKNLTPFEVELERKRLEGEELFASLAKQVQNIPIDTIDDVLRRIKPQARRWLDDSHELIQQARETWENRDRTLPTNHRLWNFLGCVFQLEFFASQKDGIIQMALDDLAAGRTMSLEEARRGLASSNPK